MKMSGVLLSLILLSMINKAVVGEVRQFFTTLVPFYTTWNQLFTTSDQSQNDKDNIEKQGECNVYVDTVINKVLDLIHESPQLFIDHDLQTTAASGIGSHSTSYISSATRSTTAKSTKATSGKKKRCETKFTSLGDHCYYFGHQAKSWHDALQECKNLGAELAHPSTREENSLLTDSFSNRHKNETMWWIGGTDEANEGEWVWAHDNSPLTYTDWGTEEPNDSLGMEDCMHYWFWNNWEWNDSDCDQAHAFLCQK